MFLWTPDLINEIVDKKIYGHIDKYISENYLLCKTEVKHLLDHRPRLSRMSK